MKVQRERHTEIRGRIKAAACALFRAKGFDNTTVADLLATVQIDEQAFHAYFHSLDELLEVVWAES